MAIDSKTRVVILGAGVIGLTIGHVLTEGDGGSRFNVTVVARDMPEDLSSQGFASPWAGANWSPMQYDERLHGWERHTFDKLWDMIPTGLVLKCPSRIYFETQDAFGAAWWKDIVRDFRVLPDDGGLPPDVNSVVEFHTVCLNPTLYLPWLKSQLEARGVNFVKRRIGSLDEIGEMAGDAGVVINATGLGARSLIGVEDTKVHPIRGQTITAYAPNATEFITVIPNPPKGDDATYLIPRPAPPGSVLIGGTFQTHNWDTSVNMHTAREIWQRAVAVVPALAEPETRILSHNVGLRPAREGGPRVEAQVVEMPSKGELVPRLSDREEGQKKNVLVVHAYGFGPAGYQQSWGAAEEAVKILKENLPEYK
ncbi:nucleotide-binding domain-containing protein [Auriscalpium vulgare]|uniref:Nucleotide-binding domain-containing protein n=1 Tax=Auriscalpium vulgare TaxID=40419 RepID=A0ACB8RS11_9AGAM|nr:nucleotide-binding domain-containing protein [Auriscalpium vulgare]